MSSAPKLEGKLNPKGLADLLKKVEGNKGAAYMLVSDGLAEKCLYFSVGAIRLTTMGKRRGMRLEDAILAHPRVDPGTVEAARRTQSETGESLEEILDTHFSLREVVKECSTAIVRDEVLDLLVWDGASYEYAESNPPPKIFDPRLEAVKLSFGVNKLLKEAQEGSARVAPLIAKLPSGKTRLLRGSAWTQGAPADAEKPVCIAIAQGIPPNGAFFEDVLIHARRKGFDALRVAENLDKMLAARTVEPPKKGPGGQVVSGLTKEEELEQAKRDVGEIEGALDVIINELVARQRLAKGYLAMGDQAKAVYNLKRVGDELLHRGRGEEAIDAFRGILKIVPHDFGVREKIAFLYEKAKKIPEAIAEGLDLAKLYKQFGLFNRAKNIFRRVISLEPENIDFRRQLIELLVKLKDNQEAVVEYENLAEIYSRKNQEQELLAVYQHILAMDPGNQAARQKTQAIVRAKPGFWIPYAGVAAGFVVLVIISAVVSSEYRAVKEYREARRHAFALADSGDYGGARARVDSFLAVYDGSRIASKAETLKKQLRELEETRIDRMVGEEYARALQLDAGNFVDKAKEVYIQVRAQGKGTKWEGLAAERLREIEKKNESAEQLAKKVKRLESDRNLREAFEVSRDIVRQYPWSDAAQRLDVKLEVQSIPPQAQVIVDGRPVGRTPVTIRQQAAAPFTLALNLAGFELETRQVDFKENVSYPYVVEMKKALRWKAMILGPIEAAPLIDDDTMYVGGRDQRIYAFDLEGRPRWSRSLGLFADVVARPVRAGERLVVGDRTGGVTALEAETGSIAWRAKMRGPAMPIVSPNPGTIVVADEEGAVVAFDLAKGTERWRASVPGGLSAAPIAHEGAIVAPAGEGFLLVLDAATGKETGRIPTGERLVASPAAAGVGFVVATEGGAIRLISREGRPVWSKKARGSVGAAPLVAGGAVFVAAGNMLQALELQDGSERFEPPQYPAAIRATPAFRANRVYVATGDGAVHALTSETGLHLWTYRTRGEILASPLPGGDTVFVASTDFGIYAIRAN